MKAKKKKKNHLNLEIIFNSHKVSQEGIRSANQVPPEGSMFITEIRGIAVTE